MTREELKEHCEKKMEMCELWAISQGKEPSGKVYEEHKMILELLEQTTWILCSERLPKIAGVYRVTRYYLNNNYVDGCFFDGSNTWYDDNRINHERAYADNVIAWQENPEPYKIT